jgi:hypothetical protein
MLAVALHLILYNFFESFWMRGTEILWVAFVILAVDIARYWKPFSTGTASARIEGPKAGQSWPLPTRADANAANSDDAAAQLCQIYA